MPGASRHRYAVTVATVLHPVGSLPPQVYWKRRLFGFGVLLIVAVVSFLLVTGGGNTQAASVAATSTSTAPAQTPQLELVPAQPLVTTTPATSTGGDPTTSTGAPATSAPPAKSAPPTTSSPSTSTAPAQPVPCTDAMLSVQAGSQQPSWSVQDKPALLMTVQNVSDQPCVRDVGTTQQEWGLFDGDTRLWGSNDCQRVAGEDVRTLQPKQKLTFDVQWSGLTSDRSCQATRSQLAPGDYQLRARMGSAQSDNFTLTFR